MPIGGTAFFGQNQHMRLTTTYLNQLNRRGDPGPGLNVGGRTDFVNGGQVGFSGSIAQPYAGFNGGKWTVTNPWAAEKADPDVGPLYGGIYCYVQVDTHATVPLVRGNTVFWLDELNYIITAAGVTATVPNKIAGIAINNTYPGYWDFIQISGLAMVRFNAAGTIGQVANVDPAGAPPIYPTLGATIGPNSIGSTRLVAPAVNALSPVELNIQQGYNF